MNKSFTLSLSSYNTSYSLFETTGTSLLIFFTGPSVYKIIIGGIDINTFQPSSNINFVIDSPSFIVDNLSDANFLLDTSSSFITLSPSLATYYPFPNPITSISSVQLASIYVPFTIAPALFNLEIQLQSSGT